MTTRLPLILCGKSPAIAASVSAGLLPEFEVIHVILTPAAGISDIPILLRGEVPPASESANVGTRNYSGKPVAVCLGAGYDDEVVAQMRAACKGSAVPWLRPDMDRPRPPVGPGYGEALVVRAKECWRELAEEGKTEGDGVYYY